jgi:mono/diheme cytochrome c family protein/plastocyanin
MTDEPGRPPEERLPATRPASSPVPTDRFSAPPSAHRNDLTPERAARIVRQSASARWVGFISVVIVALFVMGYYFYEVGLPGGFSQPRLEAASLAQQVTDVERGYNIYQANCAQCHGVNGEGGKGPTLNRQDKLFAHLNPDYIHNMLQVGGRYACGNPNSIMPVWSNTGTPPGPLNYKQIEDVISFIRASKDQTFRVMDPGLFEPVIDPTTGEEETFQGWVDPNYVPAPGSTPFPACWSDEFTKTPAPSGSAAASGSPGASAAPSGSPAASESPGPSESEGSSSAAPSGSPEASGSPAASAPAGAVLNESALNIAYEVGSLAAPPDAAFQIVFENKDAGTLHNIEIKDPGGTTVFKGAIFPGVATQSYAVGPLPAGAYTFACSVHPTMTGTLKVGS